MISIPVTLELQEEDTPQTLRLYHAYVRENASCDEIGFGQDVLKHLEASLELEEQVETLQAQVDAYHEYVFELQSRLELLDPIHTGITHILEEIRELKQARQPQEEEQEESAPKKHAKPSMAIRALKRIQEQKDQEDTP